MKNTNNKKPLTETMGFWVVLLIMVLSGFIQMLDPETGVVAVAQRNQTTKALSETNIIEYTELLNITEEPIVISQLPPFKATTRELEQYIADTKLVEIDKNKIKFDLESNKHITGDIYLVGNIQEIYKENLIDVYTLHLRNGSYIWYPKSTGEVPHYYDYVVVNCNYDNKENFRGVHSAQDIRSFTRQQLLQEIVNQTNYPVFSYEIYHKEYKENAFTAHNFYDDTCYIVDGTLAKIYEDGEMVIDVNNDFKVYVWAKDNISKISTLKVGQSIKVALQITITDDDHISGYYIDIIND